MIVTGMPVTAKRDFLMGVHQPGDTYMVALYGPSADLSPFSTEFYTPDGEISIKGYKAGGMALSGYKCVLDGVTACMGWTYDPVWKNVTIEAHGAAIYNASKDNRVVAISKFDQPIRSTNGNFRLEMPAVDAENAPVWLA